MLEWIAIGSLLVSICSLGLTVWTLKKSDTRRHDERFLTIEKEVGTVDHRIMVACHERVKRDGEYWEFHNKILDFIDAVNRTGILK